MAIISIPTSIGGVSIPGTTTNGPLGPLFNNPFSQTNLQYPRDLQSSQRGHYVTFLIKDINPIGYRGESKYDVVTGIKTAAADQIDKFINKATNYITNSNSDATQASSLTFEEKKYTNRGSVSLYIPETMAFQYGASYGGVSLTDVMIKAGSSIMGGITDIIKGQQAFNESKRIENIKGSKARAAASKAASQQAHLRSARGKALSSLGGALSRDAIRLGLNEAGLAINPQLQLLFENIGFRTYQMAFTFTPYSQQESQNIKRIIDTFKQYSAPRAVQGAAGMFFIPPAIFKPTFYFNGTENKNINAVTESVITNVDVNHAPNGWATFNDGSPVQTTLTLQLTEIEILDRDKLIQGNY